MLQLNFNRLFKARGVDKPYSFLRSTGFSVYLASKITNNRVHVLDLKMVEKLCLALNCSPNDFLEWTPNAGDAIADDHPLHQLRWVDKVIDLQKMLNTVPLDKLAEVEAYIKEKF